MSKYYLAIVIFYYIVGFYLLSIFLYLILFFIFYSSVMDIPIFNFLFNRLLLIMFNFGGFENYKDFNPCYAKRVKRRGFIDWNFYRPSKFKNFRPWLVIKTKRQWLYFKRFSWVLDTLLFLLNNRYNILGHYFIKTKSKLPSKLNNGFYCVNPYNQNFSNHIVLHRLNTKNIKLYCLFYIFGIYHVKCGYSRYLIKDKRYSLKITTVTIPLKLQLIRNNSELLSYISSNRINHNITALFNTYFNQWLLGERTSIKFLPFLLKWFIKSNPLFLSSHFKKLYRLKFGRLGARKSKFYQRRIKTTSKQY